MQHELIVSASPHIRAADDVKRIMWSVVLALLPAVGMSILYFGLDAVRCYVLCVLAAEATEVVCLKMRGKPLSHALDGSALITALLLAMTLPPTAAGYVLIVGSVFAIAIAKHCFGGLGHNIWNPALAARIFVQFAYPQQISLSKWTVPNMLYGSASGSVDAVTSASPLAKEGAARILGYGDLFMGNGVVGCLGETCKMALLVGGIYLILRNVIDWRVPVSYIATVALLVWALPLGEGAPAWQGDPIYHVLTGGLILGAFFMATDMVTTPITPMGRTVFGIGCGVVVVLVRRWGGYPEGVCYSIVLMNTVTPLIDRWVKPRIYGTRRLPQTKEDAA
jgi:H+/Na+-translocating ferredoxin:NAD+ oxidoreductase subunit D